MSTQQRRSVFLRNVRFFYVLHPLWICQCSGSGPLSSISQYTMVVCIVIEMLYMKYHIVIGIFMKNSLVEQCTLYFLYFTEKYLVHEFATLRYGVFQEYPSPGENQFYFSTTFGRLDPVRCTVGLRGIIKNAQGFCLFTSIDPDTGEFPPGCAYIPYPYRAAGTASMMDHQYVREVQHLLYTSTSYMYLNI